MDGASCAPAQIVTAMVVGSSGFHEKACRGLYIKRFTFFSATRLRLALFPIRSGFHTHSDWRRQWPRGAGRNPMVSGKGRPCLLVIALSGVLTLASDRSGQRDQDLGEDEKKVVVAGVDSADFRRPAAAAAATRSPPAAAGSRPRFSRARAASPRACGRRR
jgi:hypothetical protein